MYVNGILLAAAVVTVAKSEVHVIDVGESGLTFEPQTINPKKGDTVIFHLYPKHNVASTTFDKPCESSDDSWFSGPFDQTDNGKKKFVVNVTSEDPVWYYCAVPEHCQNGMVGAWNAPTSGNTIEAFAGAAKDVSKSSAPSSIKGGELLEDEQIASLTSGNTSPTETANSSSAEPTSEATPTPSGPGGQPAPSNGSVTGTGTPSATESSPSPTSSQGAAEAFIAAPMTGVFAMIIGLAAWFL